MSISLPCSTLAAWNVRLDERLRRSVRLASCDETDDRPGRRRLDDAVDDDLPGPQLGAAVGVDRDDGLVLPLGDRRRRPTSRRPAGSRAAQTAIGALKPSLRCATTFRPIDPPRTSGHLGLDDLDRERGLLGHGDRQAVDRPGPERDVVLPEDELGRLSANSEGTSSFGSTGLPVDAASEPASGASALAVNRTGTVAGWRPSRRPRSPRPAGSLRPRCSGRRRSRPRPALTRIAWRFPRGTATAIGPGPALERLVGDAHGQLRRDRA